MVELGLLEILVINLQLLLRRHLLGLNDQLYLAIDEVNCVRKVISCLICELDQLKEFQSCKLVEERHGLTVERNEMVVATDDVLPVGLQSVGLDEIKEDVIVVDVGYAMYTFTKYKL